MDRDVNEYGEVKRRLLNYVMVSRVVSDFAGCPSSEGPYEAPHPSSAPYRHVSTAAAARQDSADSRHSPRVLQRRGVTRVE